MFKPSTKALSLTAALAFAATGALAQSPAAHTGQATQAAPTKTIGVSPEDAKEALQKAKPQADTGTLVRTEPPAAERARNMADNAQTTTQTRPATAPAGAAAVPHQPSHTAPSQGAHTMPKPAAIKSHTTTGTVTNTTTPNAAMGITGTMPGANPSSTDATNTRDNAEKAHGATSTDTMGNHTSGKPAAK